MRRGKRRGAWTLSFLVRRQEALQDCGSFVPLASLTLKLAVAGASEFVIFGFSIVVRDAPFGGDEAFLFELEQRGIQRAVIEGKQVAAGLLDAAGDAVTVKRAESLKCFEDHQSQSPLQDIFLFAH